MSRTHRRTGWAIGLCLATVFGAGLASPAVYATAGGSAVTDGSDAFVAKLQIGDTRSCTGVLVAPQWVLTSADCFSTAGGPATAGTPPLPTTVTLGRNDLNATGGHVAEAIKVEPRADRDVALVQLDSAITDITPAALAGSPAATGDTLRTATFGRTATEWAPNRLQTSQWQVTGADATTMSLAGSTDTVSLCKGDAGGPLFTSTNTLVGIDTAAYSHGCLGSTETREGAVGTLVDDLGDWIHSFATTTPDSYFQPVSPIRILDTRTGTGTTGNTTTPVPGNTAVKLQITGKNGVPATDVTAVALTVAVVSPSNGGLLIAYPDQTALPTTSNIDFAANTTLANYLIVPVGADGAIDLYNKGAATTHLIADLSGYFTTDYAKAGNTTYTPMTPARLLDTRNNTGHTGGRPAAGSTVTLTVGGVDSIPTTNVAAVALTLTAVNPSTGGFLIAYPHGATRPATSNLQYQQTIADAITAIVPVSADGKVDIWTSNSTDLLADVAGYFTTGRDGMKFHAAGPQRLEDTRNNGVPIPANGSLTVPPFSMVSGPSPAARPASASATATTAIDSVQVYNVTLPSPAGGGFIENYPAGAAQPGTSNIDFNAGQTIANLVLAPLAKVSSFLPATTFFNHCGSSTNIIFDYFGEFVS